MTEQISDQRNRRRKHKAWYRLRRPHDDLDTTRHYTPQEIEALSRGSSNNAGIIRPGTGDLHMPTDLVDTADGRRAERLPGVMLVIIALAVIWILIIGYLVSQMPSKN